MISLTPRRNARSSFSPLRWGISMLALGSFLLITPFRVVRVVGNSMWPTLQNGQALLVDLGYYRLTGLRRGDVVVLRHGDENWVKRLVGLPGDRLALLYGTAGDIEGVIPLAPGKPPATRGSVITIPPEHLYVLGDNMEVSKDSRIVGPLPFSELLGVVRTTAFARSFPLPSR
jgi:signal peptidase I